MKLIKNISAIALAAGVIALPGAAHAGTSTATGTAKLDVINQCVVTGSTVGLGTYFAAQKWSDVAAALGSATGTTLTAGSRGAEYLNWGSVTCTNGTPYTLNIHGTGTNYSAKPIKITIGTKVALLSPFIKKVGSTVMADGSFAGLGAVADYGTEATATGTGAEQAVTGSVLLRYTFPGTTILSTDALGTVGSYTDALTYTLNF